MRRAGSGDGSHAAKGSGIEAPALYRELVKTIEG
jgi:hypothetical protein